MRMDGQTYVPRTLEERVRAELAPGERIEWMEVPIARFFTPLSRGLFLFSIPWTAFSIFWVFMASGLRWPDLSSAFGFFPLFGLPFVLIGFWLMSSPLRTHNRLKRTVYAITDRRAILIQGGRNTTIRSFGPGDLDKIHRREKADGSGDVYFSIPLPRSDDQDVTEALGFSGVADARHVERLLKELGGRGDRGGQGDAV
jgi:hypothetical protein